MKIIILAGGSGCRLWPMSRRTKAKQFFSLISDQSMIHEVYDRLAGAFPVADIYFSTNPGFQALLKEIFPNFSQEQIIIEPEKRDTAPAMGFVAAHLMQKFPDEPLAFIPSDHYIANRSLFIKYLQVAEQLIRETGKMIDIGVKADFPSTCLGYIQIGEKYRQVDEVEVYHFKRQVEKPDLQTAQGYLANGDYLWHANFFMWTPRKFLAAYQQHAPRMYQHLAAIIKFLAKNDQAAVEREYSQLEKVSIDYAVAEKLDSADVLIIKGDFDWADLGTWDVLFTKIGKVGENLTKGSVVTLATENSLIYGQPNKIIATIGLKDMIVVDTKDALLICPKDRSQEVKKILEKIREQGGEKFL